GSGWSHSFEHAPQCRYAAEGILEVEPEHGTALLAQDEGVAHGLGDDELLQGELTAGDGQVLIRLGGDLEIDPRGGSALVILPGRVEEARAPAEGDRPSGAGGDGTADAG